MKKYFLLALVVWTGIASSCKYDDDEVWDSVNNLADRVASLEAATKQMNSDIVALQSIVSALQKQVSVSKVETLADGCIIHFSDGTKATIKNGEDGKDGVNAPVINVAKENGKYYWTITIDGETEWLTDEAGNKLAVSGKDGSTGATGADGKTPVLGVDADGYWTIDGEVVKDANGNALKAKGEDGDSQFEGVTSGDGYIVITMADGTTEYKLPLLAAVKYKQGETEVAADGLVLEVNGSVTLTYDVPNLGSKYSVEVLKQEGVTVKVNENKKELEITLVDATVTYPKALILFYNGNQTITSVLTFDVAWSENNANDVARVNGTYYSDLVSAVNAAQSGSVIQMAKGNFEIPTSVAGKTLVFEGSGDETIFDFTKAYNVGSASITFKNLKFQGKNENVMSGFGIQHTTGHIAYEDCTFDGAVTNENYGTVSYKNCIFTGTGYITTYAVKSATFDGCTFDKADSRAVLVYSHGDIPVEVSITECDFKAAAKAYTYAGDWTAAIEIDTTNIPTEGTKVTITDCTYAENYNGLYRDKSSTGKANAKITVDGTEVP